MDQPPPRRRDRNEYQKGARWIALFFARGWLIIYRRQDTQPGLQDSIMKRRLHDCDLAVKRHAHALAFRAYPNLFGTHRQKIFLLTQAAKQCAQCQPNQAQESGSIRDVKTELAGVEARTAANVQSLHLIFVVADEDKRCATRQRFSIDLQTNVKKGIAAQHRNRGPNVRRPFTRTQPLLLLAFANDAWVKAEARIVDEDVSINFAEIDVCYVTIDDGFHRGLKLERDVQVLGEMIHRPQR